MRYRRANVPGGTYCFTVNLAERQRTLLVDHIDLLRGVMRKVKTAHSFHIDAMVILPDHLHVLWTLPDDRSGTPDTELEGREMESWGSLRIPQPTINIKENKT